MVTGNLLADIGVGVSPTGIGAVIGVPAVVGGGLMMAHGVDVIHRGIKEIWSGKPALTLTSKFLLSQGASQQATQWVDVVFDAPTIAVGGVGLFKKFGFFGKGGKSLSLIESTDVVGAESAGTRVLSRAEQNALKAQIRARLESPVKTGFPVLEAKINQISGDYLPDTWEMTTLSKDDLVYGGLPGSSAYFTDENAILNSSGDRNVLYRSLQVRLNPERGSYRPNIGVYQVTEDIRVPTGIIKSNPTFGPGGEVQFFIGNGFSNKLTLLYEIELRGFYEQAMSAYRPGY